MTRVLVAGVAKERNAHAMTSQRLRVRTASALRARWRSRRPWTRAARCRALNWNATTKAKKTMFMRHPEAPCRPSLRHQARSQGGVVGRLRSGKARRALERRSRPPTRFLIPRRRAGVRQRASGSRAAGPQRLSLVQGWQSVYDDEWRTIGGREFAAACLLPLAEAEVRSELKRMADAAKKARDSQRSSSARLSRL
jgi:hypothetical protein